MAGKMRNCTGCGKIFVSVNGTKICLDCQAKEREKEREVVNYVRDHPKSLIPAIMEATNCTEHLIKRLIREGRFEQVGVKLTYPCEKCGKPIVTGKLCATCMASVQKDLQAQTAKFASAAVQKKETNTRERGTGMYSNRLGR